jgi:hypothetical protein
MSSGLREIVGEDGVQDARVDGIWALQVKSCAYSCAEGAGRIEVGDTDAGSHGIKWCEIGDGRKGVAERSGSRVVGRERRESEKRSIARTILAVA